MATRLRCETKSEALQGGSSLIQVWVWVCELWVCGCAYGCMGVCVRMPCVCVCVRARTRAIPHLSTPHHAIPHHTSAALPLLIVTQLYIVALPDRAWMSQVCNTVNQKATSEWKHTHTHTHTHTLST